MDATTQLANDVHFLTAPLRFLWRSILTFLFLLLAPLLYWTIPFAFIAIDPQSDFRMLAFAYMALGPFVSAFRTMIICMLRRYRRMTADGRPYERSMGGVVAAFGFMLYGFFVSLAAELLFGFRFGVPTYTSDVAFNAAHWNLWFAGAGFAVFSPIIDGRYGRHRSAGAPLLQPCDLVLGQTGQAWSDQAINCCQARFERQHPCPSTRRTSGRCPGYVVDHVRPLECGGADAL